MAKAKTTAPKKSTVAKKKPTTAKKTTTTTKKKPAISSRKTTARKTTTSVRKSKPSAGRQPPLSERQRERTTFDFSTAPKEIQELTAKHEPHISLLPAHTMEVIMSEINAFMREFQLWSENNLTLTQRRRKIGAGIRNYGFMEKVADLAAANPQFAQFFDVASLHNSIKNIDMCRDIVLALQSFQCAVSNTMFVYSTDAFNMSRIFYQMLRTMSRQGDPTAIQLFRTLSPFFTRPKRANAEPTEKELEQDLHALLHGTADGKIVVENVSPKATKGVRKVVDEVSKGRATIKESADVEIKE